MNFRIVTISLFVFAFLTVSTTPLYSQWQVDHEFGFKIEVPASWAKTIYTEGTDKIYDFLSQDERIFIEVRAFSAGEGFTNELLAKVFEESVLQEGKRVSFNESNLNGLEGKMGIYDALFDGNRYDIFAFYGLTPENGFVIWSLTEAGQMEYLRSQINQVISSFTLIDRSMLAFEGSSSGASLQGSSSTQNQENSSTNKSGSNFNSASNILEYQGKTYRTVQIGNQTWMAENLDVGKMIVAEKYSGFQSDNSVIEKYCFDDKEENCEKWGGLYTWKEMMQYNNSSNAADSHIQGICPSGWHLPTDKEWTALEKFVDSDKGISDNNWNKTGTRGTDSGKKLKAKEGWTSNQYVPFPNGIDGVGFTVLAVGNKSKDGFYSKPGYDVYFWTATEHEGWKGTAYVRKLSNRFDNINRVNEDKRVANPVRCVKD